ncbi:hypothetical protein ACQ86K_08875 [Mucilaginibacter sp. P19]|uniref:hypothetical protein n=1 Tax=Mucilaginibacter sp. P19 TaxID=3423947 RepID=UPI003D67B10F
MKPFFITIAKNLTLLIVPDSDAHADGHPVLTYTYSIYRRDKSTVAKLNQPDKLLQANKKTTPITWVISLLSNREKCLVMLPTVKMNCRPMKYWM